MPALPVVPGVLKARVNWTYGDKAAANVMHLAYSGGPTASLPFVTAVAGDMATGFGVLSGFYGGDVTFDSVEVFDLASDTGASYEAVSGTTGDRAGTTLPANSAVLQQYSVARRYRGGHARQYLPFFTASDLDTPQTWLPASVSSLETDMNAFLTGLVGITVSPFTTTGLVQVGYRPTGRVPKTSALVDVITPTGIAVEVASMRRRDGRH